MKILAYTDEYCYNEINSNIGLYNDVKVRLSYLLHITLVFQPVSSWFTHTFDTLCPKLPRLGTQISFNSCQSCVSWPNLGDDDQAGADLDDNFDNYHMYDSKICGAAAQYKETCGWGCKKQVKKNAANGAKNYNARRSWNGFEKFCLFFWSFARE